MQASLTTHKFMYAELQAGPIKRIKLLAWSLHIYRQSIYVYNVYAYTFERLQNKLSIDTGLKLQL